MTLPPQQTPAPAPRAALYASYQRHVGDCEQCEGGGAVVLCATGSRLHHAWIDSAAPPTPVEGETITRAEMYAELLSTADWLDGCARRDPMPSKAVLRSARAHREAAALILATRGAGAEP